MDYEKQFNYLLPDEKYAFNTGYQDGFDIGIRHPGPLLADAYNAGYKAGARDRLDEAMDYYGLPNYCD
jgi:hypothetical protein